MEDRYLDLRNSKYENGEKIPKTEIRSFIKLKKRKNGKIAIFTFLRMFYNIEIFRKYKEYIRNMEIQIYGFL